MKKLLILLLLPWAAWAQKADTLRVAGLQMPVEILRDVWGIAHIYAQTDDDLFFAQGYNAASDRLFQLELWRLQATGTTASVFGPAEIERDRGHRLFKFRGDLATELAHYHPQGKRIVEAFTRGVNAYIAEALKSPENLPIEFKILGIQPQFWTPDVVISRHQGLLSNATDELATGRLVAAVGEAKALDLSYFGPGVPSLKLDAKLIAPILQKPILAPYEAFRKPLTFKPSGEKLGTLSETEEDPDSRFAGSNNWIINGRRSASGSPMLANDPHRAQTTPALRYWVHLKSPNWDVIGGGEPTIPGISIGHNAFGAWGLTIFETDNEDIYVYETNPTNPNQYRYKGQWENLKIRKDTIQVKGQPAVVVELKYTRHGPVTYEDPTTNRLVAMRAGWLETGCSPYLASLRMGQATDWNSFRAACAFSRIPGENMIWADAKGNIGWQAVGISPIRTNWSGLVPVPGDGSHEWAGYLTNDQMPHTYNPAEGYFVTANNNLITKDFPNRNGIGWDWATPFRAHRIEEVLNTGRRHTVTDFMQLQHDEVSLPARALVPLLKAFTMPTPNIENARQQLLNWDFSLTQTSTAAAIYQAWQAALERQVYEKTVPANAREHIKTLSAAKLVEWLTAGRPEFGENPIEGRNEILQKALAEGVASLSKRLGDNPANWQYGQVANKHILIKHPLANFVDAPTQQRLNVGPAPRGGSGETVNNTGNGLNQTHGASFRIIVDTADWDKTFGTQSPGQSGNPDSPHYKDLFNLWATGQYFPAYYSREKIESVTEKRVILK